MPRFDFGPATPGQVPTHLSTAPDGLRRELSSKEGWRDFVTTTPRRPRHITARELAGLPDAARSEYNLRRARFHRSLVLAHHSQLDDIWNRWDHVVVGADADSGPGVGIALSGGPGYGKTALTVGYLRVYEREMREQQPDAFTQENEFIPVCYSSLLRRVGERSQMEHIYSFYNLPTPKRATGSQLRHRLIDTMNACQTKILCLDQAQNLHAGDRLDDAVAASLKEVMDTSGVVLILLGIDLDKAGPLSVAHGGKMQANNDRLQLARRFQLTKMQPVERNSAEWRELLATIESQLVLCKAKPGDLAQGLADNIWERSNGAIGVAYNLLRVAANAAINDGSERITRTTLNRVASTVEHATRPTRRAS